MRKLLLLASLSLALCFTGCTPDGDARKLAEKFLKTNLAENDIKIVSFGKLDSTRFVTDSVVFDLRTAAYKSHLFVDEMKYEEQRVPAKLLYLPVTYRNSEGDTVRQTIYMDEAFSWVVAVKQN